MSEELCKTFGCVIFNQDHLEVKLNGKTKLLELTAFSDFSDPLIQINLSSDKVTELIDFLQQCKTHLEQQQ